MPVTISNVEVTNVFEITITWSDPTAQVSAANLLLWTLVDSVLGASQPNDWDSGPGYMTQQYDDPLTDVVSLTAANASAVTFFDDKELGPPFVWP